MTRATIRVGCLPLMFGLFALAVLGGLFLKVVEWAYKL